jgi:Putative beta-barrel porin-2, OmpL-like. bbp2
MRSQPSGSQILKRALVEKELCRKATASTALPESDLNLITMKTLLRKTAGVAVFPALLVMGVVLSQAPRCYAQTQAQSQASPKVAALSEPPDGAAADLGTTKSASAGQPVAPADSALPPSVAKELGAMKARIELLEMQLKEHAAGQPPTVATEALAKPAEPAAAPLTASPASPVVAQSESTSAQVPATPAVDNETPFAYADWTWLNGTPRNKDAVWDSKFFTPEVRFDTHYVSDFNHPKDDTIGGSSEIFRSNEVQAEQISFGGDFHWQNVRGRVLTMFGMFAVTTPRNDASNGRGQWDLRNAYRYVSEAYGGYHWNVNHGLNLDAGIFVSYIGLFSYYNFDNWAYQPSYVSSNTPWFFNGVRLQWFPTNKLKIEPWFINGWQSYGRFNGRPGLGGQILYRPNDKVSIVFNNYGMGTDTLGNPRRTRIHSDDSVTVKYYDRPGQTLDKMAFSLTGDAGCEYGGGVSCHGNGKSGPKQSFIGYMIYNRFWFDNDKYGLTVGGGQINNPGRYLTLVPPINGADATSGTPYFTANPGDPFKAWDTSITWDYMPRQYITFRTEYGYRHASVPYFTGHGGITPAGGNTGTPGVPVPGFTPDLRKDEASLRLAVMVKF